MDVDVGCNDVALKTITFIRKLNYEYKSPREVLEGGDGVSALDVSLAAHNWLYTFFECHDLYVRVDGSIGSMGCPPRIMVGEFYQGNW